MTNAKKNANALAAARTAQDPRDYVSGKLLNDLEMFNNDAHGQS